MRNEMIQALKNDSILKYMKILTDDEKRTSKQINYYAISLNDLMLYENEINITK